MRIPYTPATHTADHTDRINAWNAAHPVGTSVLYATDIRKPLDRKGITTSPAFVLHDQPSGAVVRVNTHTFPVPLDRLEAQQAPHLWAEDFPVSYQRRMILAYPQIAGMDNDEAWLARPDEKRAAFDRVLANAALRRTHVMYLESQATTKEN